MMKQRLIILISLLNLSIIISINTKSQPYQIKTIENILRELKEYNPKLKLEYNEDYKTTEYEFTMFSPKYYLKRQELTIWLYNKDSLIYSPTYKSRKARSTEVFDSKEKTLHAEVNYPRICVKLLKTIDEENYKEIYYTTQNRIIKDAIAITSTDQDLLVYIAKNDKNWNARRNAIEEIDSKKYQDLLSKIAMNDISGEVRSEAVKKLSNKTILTNIFNNDKNNQVRIAALKNITNQKILVYYAKNDKDKYIRKAAVTNLKDQSVLADIAISDEDDYVRKTALEKLDTLQWQNLLASIVKNDKEYNSIRKVALKKLDTIQWQNLFSDIVKNNSEYYSLRYEALIRVDKNKLQNLLADVAKTDLTNRYSDIKFREKVLNGLDPTLWQNLFGDIVMNDEIDYDIRIEAFNKIIDQKIIADIVVKYSEDYDDYIFTSALDKINYQELLTYIAKRITNFGDYTYGPSLEEVLEKITNLKLLKSINRTCENKDLKYYIRERIKNLRGY